LDLEFLFSVVLSLFAVMFAYDAVNGEKERGTLRLALSNPVSRSTFIVGKLLGTFLALFVPLLIPVMLGILLLPLMGVHLDGDELVRLLLILGIGFLFFATFLVLSVMVSASTRHSSYSFLIMMVIWIGCVLIIPRTAVLMSARWVEVPTVDFVEKQKREYASQLMTEDRSKMSAFKPDPSTPPQEMINEFSKFMAGLASERDAKISEFNARLNEDRSNRQRDQQRLAMNLARLSPATSMSLAMTNLAGTSIAMKDRFIDQANEYQSIYRTFMQDKNPGSINMGGGVVMRVAVNQGGSNVSVGGAEETKINPSELPVFEYRDVSLTDVSTAALPDVAILTGYALAFFAGAFFLFLRFDVR
jgi:ABC-type transport system involved in multi-copper enzyme maturation permease subunit